MYNLWLWSLQVIADEETELPDNLMFIDYKIVYRGALVGYIGNIFSEEEPCEFRTSYIRLLTIIILRDVSALSILDLFYVIM